VRVSTLAPGAVIAGKYRIEALLGRGGMGAVYAATNEDIGRRVAIKVLVADLQGQAEAQRRFELEAQAAAVIGHPGIVDVLDMGQTDAGEPYIVMEQLEGLTLRQVMTGQGALSPGLAVAAMGPVLDALAAAHAAGVVHRDIKPANIFVCSRPRDTIKLLDFGVSRFSGTQGFTRTGVTLGTPKYMAPEQVLGERTVGPAADLFSVGAVLYRALVGRSPLEGLSETAAIIRALKAPQAPLLEVKADVPAPLAALVDALLSRELSRRPADAAEVAAQLRACAPSLDRELFALLPALPRVPTRPRGASKVAPAVQRRGAQAAAATEQELPPVAPNRTPAMLAAVSALALVVGGAAAWGLLQARRAKPPAAPVATPRPDVAVAKPQVAPATPTRPTVVTVTLDAMPRAARFTVDGLALACNPCTVHGEAGTKAQVEVAADGFEPVTLKVEYREGATEQVALAARTAPRPVEPARPTPAPPKKRPLSLQEDNPYR
jgi:serine/threonine-protein kinase